MSQENVESIRRAYEAFAAGNFDAVFELLDERFVYRTRDELPGGGSFEGVDTFRDRLSALEDVFGDVRFEPQEFIDAGELVVVVIREIARGRASGVSVEQTISHVWTIRNGRGVELRVYSLREDALEAAGLPE